MRITPLDVRKQEFRKAMRGLDPDEVYAFLATVAEEYETVLNDNKALRERLLELDDKVQEYRTMEKTLRDTLLTAERVTVEAKDNARREAAIIVKEAQIEAEKALRDIKNEAIKLRQEVSYLRSQRDAYLAKMKLVAESHLDFIKTAFNDFSRDDAVVDEHSSTPAPAKPEPPANPQNMFESRPAASDPKPTVDKVAPSTAPTQPTPQPVPAPEPKTSNTVDTVPIPTPEKSVADSHPATQSAPRPVPPVDTAPRATAPPAGNSGDGLADISSIIERMRASQQEVSGQTSERSWKQIVDEASTQTAVAPPPEPEPEPAMSPSRNEVTSEFNLDEIKRELGMRKDDDH